MQLADDNPFAEPSELPFGLPDFARIEAEHFSPAITAGMAAHRDELDAIAGDPAAPTFENTIEAMERSGQLLERTVATFHNLVSADATPDLDELQPQIATMLAAHSDEIYLNAALFHRIDALVTALPDAALAPEQVRLLQTHHRRFLRAGAGLDDAAKAELRTINTEIAELSTRFDQNLMADTVAKALHLSNVEDLDGLSEADIAAAAQAARGRDLQGYLLTLILPTNQPALEYLTNREVRRRLFEASVSRGSHGGPNDTRTIALRLVQLRARRAALLGYPSHADYAVADGTAKSLAPVQDMFALVVGPAMRRADAEAAELTAALIADKQPGPLQAWDWAYYARIVRERGQGLDTGELRKYFELNRVVREGIFYAAEQLYGVSFVVREDLVGYAPDVQIYEVRNPDGSPRGLFMADWYTRDTKRGGAWMSSFREQSGLLNSPPVIVINLNITKPAPGLPTLLSTDEVDTAFHEFGHVLHGLLSDVRYPSQSGTNVPQDFVEFPSQVNEMWAWHPQVLPRYAQHVETGEALPAEWAAILAEADRYGQGFATTEYTAAALLDLAWHSLNPEQADALSPDDVLEFEVNALRQCAIDHPLIPPRYRTGYFAHIFAGGYSANYWAYLWSEVLDADTVDWFHENGGLQRANGEHFATELLSRGDSRDPMLDFELVRGRPPRIEPLLKRRGLLKPE